MARGIQKWSEDAIARLQNEGRGKGRGPTYLPWIRVMDMYSDGRSREFYSHKFGREHQLLSDGEWGTYLMLEWAHDVVDVREQFPLPRDITQEIAHDLGIRHQYYPKTHVPFVMTLDFLVTRVRDGKEVLQALNIKTADELEDADVVGHLEIARATCHGMGIDHHLVASEMLSKTVVTNLGWIRDAQLDKDAIEPFPGFYEDHMSRMSHDIAARRYDGSLVDYCSEYDRRYGVEPSVGLRVARMLMTTRALRFDFNNPTPELAHMDSYQLSARPGRLRSVEN
jgi:TnsA endonuclease N terminal